MALRDDSDPDIQKMLNDSGLMQEMMTMDGVMSVAERLHRTAGATGLGWWVLYKKDGKKGSTHWFFGGD